MNLRAFDLNLLVVFDAIYSAGNISVAARNIGMSQPAMSNALRRFREAINDPLFVRHPGGVLPTAKADQLAPVVHQALNALRVSLKPAGSYDFASDVSSFGLETEELGEIVLIPALVKQLASIAPGIGIQVSTRSGSDTEEKLRYGRIDVSIDYIHQQESVNFKSQPLFDEHRVCVVRDGHPRISGAISMSEYAAMPHVTLSEQGRGFTSVHTFLAGLGIHRKVAMRVPSYHAVPRILENTDLIATIPRRIAEHYSRVYALRILELPFSMAPLRFYLKWHWSKTSDPRHAWFRQLILDLFRGV